MKRNIAEVMTHFNTGTDFVSAQPYGSGHINETYAANTLKEGQPLRFLLQRINDKIFKNPPELVESIRRVTEHIRKRMAEDGFVDLDKRVLRLLPTHEGEFFYQSSDASYWRLYSFIEEGVGYDIVENEKQAFEAAKAFGEFQKYLADMPGERLPEIIPDFHNTPKRYENFERALNKDAVGRAQSVAKEIEFFTQRKGMTKKLLDLLSEGKIPERITHNDTKMNNVLIDRDSDEALCVIDLDTVMPGLALYDFGDLVRTSTSPVAEDEPDVSKVEMQMKMFKALVQGYLGSASSTLVPAEIENLAFSGKLITFEIGLRFITDYLEGDVYFKVHREGHNLDRCRTQIALVESIEAQEVEMNELVQDVLKGIQA